MDIKSAHEILSNLSPEQRAHVAKHMVSPLRCGGLHYDAEGKPFYRVGSRRLTPDEFLALSHRLSEGTDG